MEELKVFVIDGGPCGGKSTGLKETSEKLRNYGYKAFVVPEVATELFSSGVTIGDDGILLEDFQEQALLKQLEQEARYKEIAKRHGGDKKVLLCDRGAVSGRPYLPPGVFENLIKRMGFSGIAELRDSRYNGAFHMVTAADGAEEHYTLENNEARKETPEKARFLDRETQKAWTGHPHLRILDNSTDFKTKKHKLLEHICHALGLPIPLEIERKYLLNAPNLLEIFHNLELPPVCISIAQSYLHEGKNGAIRRIRQRQQDASSVYYYEEKKLLRPGVRIETGNVISSAEYMATLRNEADTRFNAIVKNRFCFIWRAQYFELDVFQEPKQHKGLILMEIELTRENDHVNLPPFFDIVADVTTDERFTNYALARKE